MEVLRGPQAREGGARAQVRLQAEVLGLPGQGAGAPGVGTQQVAAGGGQEARGCQEVASPDGQGGVLGAARELARDAGVVAAGVEAGQRLALDHQDPLPAGPGQVEGRGKAGDAAADDEDLRAVQDHGHSRGHCAILTGGRRGPMLPLPHPRGGG